ncbi:S8 family serine peptidase [Lamprobacter modestohalophilus]|uniref:S8 family serine peptidase n=1 Tax=Lamprobacter modestohalophilus TaxID=1064514 RepID=UPI002ADEC8A4|nr:S8 family serine peptidase [Lamprobacter modestohalophilus]MEA1048645.1 S8 family serine peptidase [Lamprobacter modestohalophilus]
MKASAANTPKRLTSALLPLVGACLLVATGGTQAASERARDALAADPDLAYSPDTVLLRFKPDALPAQKQQARELVGGELGRVFGIDRALEVLRLNADRGRGVEKAIETLNNLPFVDYAEPDYVRRIDTNDPYYGYQWGLENTGQSISGTSGTANADIDADLAWGITTGNPALPVAVIDTGVDYTHPDLAANIWVNPGEIPGNGIDDDGNGYVDDIYGYDFFANDGDPMDEGGHGTHVAGTICAEGNNRQGISGVAWGCKIVALRFLGPDGGYTSDAVMALDYAVAMGVPISNNSWGGGGFSDALYGAIASAAASGHLFVAAAGNSGVDTDSSAHFPSSYDLDNILSVAATDNKDRLASFSNYGANSVDLGAPGVDIVSTYPNNKYIYMSGTSMAAPHISGVAALLLDRHPDWGYAELRDRLFASARPLAALDGKTLTGGIVNANEALWEATAPPSAPASLSAMTVSHSAIDLAWSDTADTEDGFKVERSQDNGATWTQIDSLAANTQAFSDTGLDAETSYEYRLFAFNSAGASEASNTASATTLPVPSGQEVLSSGETAEAGTVSGTYQDTWYDDAVTQSITERSSGGRPASRYSYLQHTWEFQVPAGSAILSLNAWSTASSDGDRFDLSYSVDGSPFVSMLTIAGGGSSSTYSYLFPPETSGTVSIRVTDTDRTPGNVSLDTITIDQLSIWSETELGDPPVAPSNLSAAASVAGQIDLDWIDNASDEQGFEVERSLTGAGSWSRLDSLAADTHGYSDTTVASETTYDYRVRAFNGAGYSDWSNLVTATSLAATEQLELSASGQKIRGQMFVDLSWNDTAVAVDIIRDGVSIATSVSGGAYFDDGLGNGGGTFVYQVCETGTSTCSNRVTVAF